VDVGNYLVPPHLLELLHLRVILTFVVQGVVAAASAVLQDDFAAAIVVIKMLSPTGLNKLLDAILLNLSISITQKLDFPQLVIDYSPGFPARLHQLGQAEDRLRLCP
jgi:hypothetical protein